MKTRVVFPIVALTAFFLLSQANDAQAFGFMHRLHHGCGCCEIDTCCAPEPSCCAPEPSCCAPEPCCDPCDPCCRRRPLRDLFSKLFHRNRCCGCETSCGCGYEPSCGCGG